MHPIARNRRTNRLAELRRKLAAEQQIARYPCAVLPPNASKARRERCAARARERVERLSAEIARLEETCET